MGISPSPWVCLEGVQTEVSACVWSLVLNGHLTGGTKKREKSDIDPERLFSLVFAPLQLSRIPQTVFPGLHLLSQCVSVLLELQEGRLFRAAFSSGQLSCKKA